MGAHLLIGDGHYRGLDDERARWFRLVEAVERAGIEEFSILGDFFELWLAVDGAMPRWQHDMLAPLQRLKERGVSLRYVVGNKDYFVDEWNRKHGLFDRVIGGVETVPSAQGPLHLAHGDLVNHADRQYRAWRAFSRSLPLRLLARSLPKRTLRRIGERIAKRLESTNLSHKSYYPEEQLAARARELGETPGTQIYGHFHVYRELEVGPVRVITLPFLATENAGVLVDERGFHRWEA